MGRNETTREICALLKEAATARDAGDGEREEQLLLHCIELDDGTDADVVGDLDLPPFRVRPYLILAMALLERGEAARALVQLERARERWTRQPDLELILARCHEALKAWSEAEVAYRRCIELEPRAYVCVLLGSMLDRLGRSDEAVWWLHHSLVVDPNYEESHCNIGHLLARDGDVEAAAARFRRAIELDPAYVDAHVALGKLLLQRALQAPKPREDPEWQAAFDHLSRATQLAPEDLRARESLAEMRLER